VLDGASLAGCSLDQLGNCRLIAFVGDEPAGALGLETDLDCAVIRFFFVLPQQRRRKVGSNLMSSARTAARTRGVRIIYISEFEPVEFLQSIGFVKPISIPPNRSLSPRLTGSSWELDISQDGIIMR
jgi:GNAT superfamily N-acetyltransferase